MQIVKIIVDELPQSCSDCIFLVDDYCRAKNSSQWVDRTADTRDEKCMLETKEVD